MIAALSPADINYDETLSTLRYNNLQSTIVHLDTTSQPVGVNTNFCWILNLSLFNFYQAKTAETNPFNIMLILTLVL